MRKLSTKLPVGFSFMMFLPPGFYLLLRFPSRLFHPIEFAEKMLGSVGMVILIWLIYGIACLIAPSRRKD